MSSKRRGSLVSLLLLIPASIGAGAIACATSLGPGVGGDSTIYIMSARNLLDGYGLGLVNPAGEFRLIPYFPPFFPLLLALIGLTGLNLVTVAHIMIVILFAATIWLAGALIFRVVPSVMAAMLVAFLFAVSPVLIPVYSWAMSEPLAIFLGLAGLMLLNVYLEKRQDASGHLRGWMKFAWSRVYTKHGKLLEAVWPGWSFGIASAILFGLSFLTRYNSVAFVVVGVLAVLLIGRGARLRRLLESILFGILACVPMFFWLVIDLSQTTTISSRRFDAGEELAVQMVNFWRDFVNSLLFWLVPDSWVYSSPYPGILNRLLPPFFILLLILWTSIVLRRLRQNPNLVVLESRRRLLLLLSGFILVFLAVTIMVKVTTYPPITINPRMLSPVHAAVLLMTVILVSLMPWLWHAKWLRVASPVSLFLLVLWYGWNSAHVIPQYHRLGLGYYSADWQQSETIKAVKELPPDTVIITNQEMAVLILTDRPSYAFKEIYQTHPLETFSAYGNGDLSNDEPQRLFKDQGATLVLFDTIDDQFIELYGDRTAERISALVIGLYRAYRGNDGGIFYYHEP